MRMFTVTDDVHLITVAALRCMQAGLIQARRHPELTAEGRASYDEELAKISKALEIFEGRVSRAA